MRLQSPAPSPDPPPSPPVEQPPLPRRSGREQKIASCPDNIYGDNRHPVEQFKDAQKQSKWRQLVGDKEHLGCSHAPTPTATDKVPGPSAVHNNPSNNDNSGALSDDNHLAQLCQEGGVELMHYLLMQAVSDSSQPNVQNIREWTYRDITHLTKAEQEEWKTACCEELEALHRCKVFELMDRPKDQKVIKN